MENNRDHTLISYVRQQIEEAELRVPTLPCRIAHFDILGLLGRGGMGVVYEAKQHNPERVVALKVSRPEHVSSTRRHRLQREAQALARLQHPGIAQLFEAGLVETEFGPQPFFAMELVRGLPLTRFATDRNLDLHARLSLLLGVCDAVQHAHQKGVIHRDLKPSNVLVEESGQPKVLDFGVAFIIDTELQHATRLTERSQIVGTVPFMSPESIVGGVGIADTRSDVYSLGVIGFLLVSGEFPISTSGKSFLEATRRICESEPVPIGNVDRRFRGDLQTIFAKALAKAPDQRYQAVAEFRGDLQHFLHNEPIIARPPSLAYQLRKYASRNKIAVGAAVAVFLAIILGTVGTTVGLLQAREQARVANWESYRASIAAATASLRSRDPVAALDNLQAAPPGLRGWEWSHLMRSADNSLAAWTVAPDAVSALQLSNGTAVVGYEDGHVELRDAETGNITTAAQVCIGNHVRTIVTDQECDTLAIGCENGKIYFYEDGIAKQIGHLELGSTAVLAMAFSHDGGRLAVGLRDATVQIWKWRIDGPPVSMMADPEVAALLFDRGDERLFGASSRGLSYEWNAITGERLHTEQWPHQVYGIGLLGNTIATVGGTGDRPLAVVDAFSGQTLRKLIGHTGYAYQAFFNPDGQSIVTSARDRTIRVWNAISGDQRAMLTGLNDRVHLTAYDSHDERVLAQSDDGEVRLWDTRPSPAVTICNTNGFVYPVVVSPNGQIVASGNGDWSISLWKVDTGERIGVLREHRTEVKALSMSPDGKEIASGAWDPTILVWDVLNRRVDRRLHGHSGAIRSLAYSPNGLWLASGSCDGTVRLWRGEQSTSVAQLGQCSESLAFSPDSNSLIVGQATGRISAFHVTNTGDLEWREDRNAHTDSVNAVAYGPGGTVFASASADGTVRLWNARILEPTITLEGHTGNVYGVIFHPDGNRLVSGGEDRTIRIWNTGSGEQVTELRGHEGYVYSLAFTPDGMTLVTGSGDSTVRIWRSRTHRRWRER